MLKNNQDVLTSFAVTPMTMILLFLVGVIASATMVIPGVSGSMVMMILGYYYAVINTIKGFLDSLKAFDIARTYPRRLPFNSIRDRRSPWYLPDCQADHLPV